MVTRHPGVSKIRGKPEDVSRLVRIAVVASQALHHAECVGRSFEELRQWLVGERQSCPLCRVGTRLPRGRVSLVGGPGQYGWWRQDGLSFL
jgi:hypothetical protein